MSITLSICSVFDKDIAAEWQGIYETNKNLSYYSSYQFVCLFTKKFSKEKSRRPYKPVFVKASDDKRGALMFLPLCTRRENYHMLYENSSVPYCDVVVRADITKDELDYIFDHLSEVLGNTTVYFTKFASNSQMTKYLRERFTPYKKRSCGSIELLRSYDYTYRLLEKECRENIEEALDKIKTEGLVYRTDFYLNKPLPIKVSADLSMIVNGEDLSFSERLKTSSRIKRSAVIQSVKKGNDSLAVISYIDDYPVACAYGFVRNKTFILQKLASTKYGVGYSSLHLIIADIMKFLIEKDVAKRIDLGRLDDNVKSDFSPKHHHVYSFEVKL